MIDVTASCGGEQDDHNDVMVCLGRHGPANGLRVQRRPAHEGPARTILAMFVWAIEEARFAMPVFLFLGDPSQGTHRATVTASAWPSPRSSEGPLSRAG